MITTRLIDYLNHENRNDINHVICAYLKDHMEEIPSMNIETAAGNCHVSIGKLSGFIRRLGYDNWIAFKDDCRFELAQRTKIRNALRPFDTAGHRQILSHEFHQAEEDLKAIDEAQLSKLCSALQNARNIFCFGTGYCRLLGEYMQMELALINRPVILMDEKNIGNYEIHTDDLLLLFEEPDDFTGTHPRIGRSLSSYTCPKWLLSAGVIPASRMEETEVLSVGTNNNDLYLLRLELMSLVQIIVRILIA